MPRHPSLQPGKAPDWHPEDVYAALKKQLVALETLRGRNYKEVDSEERRWRNLTLNVITHGFGDPSNNVQQFKHADLVGRVYAPSMSEVQHQHNFDQRIEAFSATVSGSLDELELMGAERQSEPTGTKEMLPAARSSDIEAPSHQGLLVFISHSSKDVDLALALIDLLKDSLGLLANQIRCSSVDGYRLPVGVNTERKLRQEVNAAKIVIGLVTPSSLVSYFVMFELGARWGADLFLAPLLAGVKASELSGPLSLLNALDATSEAQLHQLLTDVSQKLSLPLQGAASYVRRIATVKALADKTADKAVTSPPDSGTLISESDPRVYLVEIREEDDAQGGVRTVFVIENRGGAVAHDVHIQSLKLGYRTVNFAPVDSIAVGGKGEILPWPEQVGPNKNNLLVFLDEDSEMKARVEHRGPPEFYNFMLELTHTNFSRKRKFSVSILVTYKIQSRLRSRLRNEKESGFFQIVSHSGFKLLS
jgi:hypothetical protein